MYVCMYFSPLTHLWKKTPCKYLHSHILLMLASLTLHGHSEWFPSTPWAVCPPLHPPSSWQACLTCAPPLPIHQDCSCISHTQVQPLDIEEHYEDTSHQFLVSSLETLSAQRQASPWSSSITSPLLIHHLFVMRMNVPLIENPSTTISLTFSVKPMSIMNYSMKMQRCVLDSHFLSYFIKIIITYGANV